MPERRGGPCVYGARGGIRLSTATFLRLRTTPEEVDPFDVALSTGDRPGRHDLGPGYLARLHEHVADVLQDPAHFLDLAEDVGGPEPARLGALRVVPVGRPALDRGDVRGELEERLVCLVGGSGLADR